MHQRSICSINYALDLCNICTVTGFGGGCLQIRFRDIPWNCCWLFRVMAFFCLRRCAIECCLGHLETYPIFKNCVTMLVQVLCHLPFSQIANICISLEALTDPPCRWLSHVMCLCIHMCVTIRHTVEVL